MTALIDYQVINDKKGQPEYVVVPFEDYLQLTKQNKIDTAHGIPSDVVDLMLDKGYSPARAWRAYLGITQKAAAAKLGISQSAYSQFESTEKPRKNTRVKIAQALGINPAQLDC